MNKRNRNIALNIIKAQAASDGGKYTERIFKYQREFFPIYQKGYCRKETYILSAIREIINYKNSDFRFFVKKSIDQNGYKSLLIYFRFNLNGKRKQISFHSFDKSLEKYISKDSSNKQKWDHGSSRQNAEDLFLAL